MRLKESRNPRGVAMARTLNRMSEVVMLVMASLAPWAFGSADAWAQFLLGLGVAVLAVLGAVAGRGSDRSRMLRCLPSLALAGLVLVGVAQATPLPERVMRFIAPTESALRAGLVPGAAERVAGDGA